MTHFVDGKLQNDSSIVIAAHQTPISFLTLNRDSSLLATMSEQGTLIRLFNSETGDKVSELRRGSESACIQHLAFEWEKGDFITCSSDRETIHVFKCPEIKTTESPSSITSG